MSEPPADPKTRQALDDLASAHVARLASGATPAERQAIYDWVSADPRHAVAFARMEAAWEAAARLRASPPPVDQKAAAGPAGRMLDRRRLVGGSIAAMVVAGAGTVAWRYLDDVKLYRTAVGERRGVTLTDGSRVHLNTASTIEASISKEVRRVRLVRGEALFEVSHDASRPFLVDAGSAELRALGTAFNVRLRDDVVELTVTKGVVAVATPGHAVETRAAPKIGAGAGAVIRSGAVAETNLDGQVMRQRTAWRDGVIEIDGETLGQVVEEFNRYRTHPIVVGDARLDSIRVGGRFEVDESDKFLAALTSSFPIDTMNTADGGVLLIARK